MNKRFQDKTAVITGAAQGIGRRVAERMAAEGGRLLLVDRSELIHELADELVGVAEVLTLTADLEQFADCQRVMAAALERFGRLDILINNVGGTIWLSHSSITRNTRSRPKCGVHCFLPYGAATPRCRQCSSRAVAPS